MRVPAVTETPGVGWIGEGVSVPLSRMAFTSATIPTDEDMSLFAASRELFRFGDSRARTLLVRLSTRQLARGEDAAFVGDDAATSDRPAGILHDVIGLLQGSPSGLESGLETLTRPWLTAAPRSQSSLPPAARHCTWRGTDLSGVPRCEGS